MSSSPLLELLRRCLAARTALFDAAHEGALRLFNGFTEGCPDLVIDLYGSTAVLINYAEPPERAQAWIADSQDFLRMQLPWLRVGILKTRFSLSMAERRGKLLFGDAPDRKVREHGVWYSIDPLMHQDTGLYLDARNLRRWALDRLNGKTVLNAFAYTGSLGVAALVGGARRVVQLDRSRRFLEVAQASCRLNDLAVDEADYVEADFFRQAGRFRRHEQRFDCVILDPPFFSASPDGVIDQERAASRMINKVRPLVNDGGMLVAVNNSLYVSGAEYMQSLEELCTDGYLRVEELIPAPGDFIGYPETRVDEPITDPAPFNHSTKIAVLRVKRKNPQAG